MEGKVKRTNLVLMTNSDVKKDNWIGVFVGCHFFFDLRENKRKKKRRKNKKKKKDNNNKKKTRTIF